MHKVKSKLPDKYVARKFWVMDVQPRIKQGKKGKGSYNRSQSKRADVGPFGMSHSKQ
jgi:hypothetical protein